MPMSFAEHTAAIAQDASAQAHRAKETMAQMQAQIAALAQRVEQLEKIIAHLPSAPTK